MTKVYALATDTDNGLIISMTDSEEKLAAMVREFMESEWDKNRAEGDGTMPDNPDEAWAIITDEMSSINSYSTEEIEIAEQPEPETVTFGHLNKAADDAIEALKRLEDLSRLVLSDISDQDTGWFYQFQAATQKAGPAIVALAPTYGGAPLPKTKNPNTNCLEGMRCPLCGSYGGFTIAVGTYVDVTDDGCEQIGDTEWSEMSFCRCHECQHDGTVKTFTEGS